MLHLNVYVFKCLTCNLFIYAQFLFRLLSWNFILCVSAQKYNTRGNMKRKKSRNTARGPCRPENSEFETMVNRECALGVGWRAAVWGGTGALILLLSVCLLLLCCARAREGTFVLLYSCWPIFDAAATGAL